MSIFEVNNEVSDVALPVKGKYRANIVKCELKQSSKGSAMISVELAIPVTDAKMVEQGWKGTNAIKIFDFIVDSDAEMCQRKKNQFIKATGIKDADTLAALAGKSVEIFAKPQVDDNYGDRMVVDKYIADSLQDAVDVPF